MALDESVNFQGYECIVIDIIVWNKKRLGIWADREESDDEDAHVGFGSVGDKKKAKNYSAPVSFVSGGVKRGNKIEGEVSFCALAFKIRLLSFLLIHLERTKKSAY